MIKRNKKNKALKRDNTNLKTHLLKITAISAAIAVSVSVTYPSFAESGSLKDVDTSEMLDFSASGKGSEASGANIVAQLQATKSEAENCADPANVKGLAHAQQKTLNDMKAMILTPINTDNIFNTAKKGGCFNALQNFPNLSGSIPSLSGIANALKDTIIKYATRKVCAAVNDALEDMLGPLNEAMDEYTKNGQIDLTGMVNKKMAEELYKIDPELGRVSKGVTDEYEWELKDVFESTPGVVAEGTASGNTNTNESETQAPPTPQASGSFLSRNYDEAPARSETESDGSLTESAKSFLKSIF